MVKKLFFILFIVLVLLSATTLWLTRGAEQQQSSSLPQDSASGEALIGGAFTLTDQNGKTVTEKDFAGKHWIVFFGFTHCPDVCPLGLMTITQALEQLGELGEQVVPVFITIDPERDTPEVMKEYMTSFDKRFVALTGTHEQIKAAAQVFKVYHSKIPGEDGNYMMDHSGYVYFMDKSGKYIQHFRHSDAADDIAAKIKAVLEQEGK